METRKTKNVTGDCINSDMERLEEEWRKRATDRRNWRLLTEKRTEKVRKKKKGNGKGNHCQSP